MSSCLILKKLDGNFKIRIRVHLISVEIPELALSARVRIVVEAKKK